MREDGKRSIQIVLKKFNILLLSSVSYGLYWDRHVASGRAGGLEPPPKVWAPTKSHVTIKPGIFHGIYPSKRLPMTLHSIHFAQYAHALLLTIIRPIIRLLHISTMPILPMALTLVMGYRLCYTHAVQPYLVHRPAKCPLLQSTVVF